MNAGILIAMLRQSLDEEEQGCLAATERDWRPDGAESCQVYTARGDGSHRTVAWCQNGYEDDFANSLHIARWDPAAVLRQVAAHREILRLHEPVPLDGGKDGTGCRTCGPAEEAIVLYQFPGKDWTPCQTLRALAGAYGLLVDQGPTDD